MTETEKKYEKASDLTVEERMLVELRDELYFGEWEKFLKDLRDRLKQRPYVDKLVKRIEEDIPRIEKMQIYELKNRVNLADLLKEEQSSKS